MVMFMFSEHMVEEIQQRLQALDTQCYDSLGTGYRPGSHKNLRSRAQIYLNFCQTHQLTFFPADDWQLVRFSRYVANTVNSFGTVQNYTGVSENCIN